MENKVDVSGGDEKTREVFRSLTELLLNHYGDEAIHVIAECFESNGYTRTMDGEYLVLTNENGTEVRMKQETVQS